MPPRSLKSIMASVAFPAFVMGHDPARRIICVSYSLSETRREAVNQWYNNTLQSRLDDKISGAIVMQRVHMDDPVGFVTRPGGDDWTILILDNAAKRREGYKLRCRANRRAARSRQECADAP